MITAVDITPSSNLKSQRDALIKSSVRPLAGTEILVNALEMKWFRGEWRQTKPTKLQWETCFIKCIADATAENPEINVRWIDDEHGSRIQQYEQIHVGISLESKNGLVNPAIKEANTKTLVELNAAVIRLIGKAEKGVFGTGDFGADPVIALNNTGAYKNLIRSISIPHITHTIMVSTGAILDCAVVENASIIIRPIMNVGIIFDHSPFSGAQIPKFANSLKHRMENFYTLYYSQL